MKVLTAIQIPEDDRTRVSSCEGCTFNLEGNDCGYMCAVIHKHLGITNYKWSIFVVKELEESDIGN